MSNFTPATLSVLFPATTLQAGKTRLLRLWDTLLAEIAEDIPKVLSIIKFPTQGRLINKRFLAMKSGAP